MFSCVSIKLAFESVQPVFVCWICFAFFSLLLPFRSSSFASIFATSVPNVRFGFVQSIDWFAYFGAAMQIFTQKRILNWRIVVLHCECVVALHFRFMKLVIQCNNTFDFAKDLFLFFFPAASLSSVSFSSSRNETSATDKTAFSIGIYRWSPVLITQMHTLNMFDAKEPRASEGDAKVAEKNSRQSAFNGRRIYRKCIA